MKINFGLGLNRVKPVHELLMTQDGRVQCSTMLNYIAKDRKVRKTSGTEAYGSTFHDKYDSYTKLMLHGNGENASNIIIDEMGHTVTAVNHTQIDTSQKVFGTGSILFDGVDDYLTVPDSDDWNFGTGDFTKEGRFRFASIAGPSGTQTLFEQSSDTQNYVRFLYDTNTLFFHVKVANITKAQYSCAFTPTLNTWYHIALVRNGSNIYMFVDGISQALTITTPIGANALGDYTQLFHIGVSFYPAATYEYYFNGWMGEIRISRGIARWTSNFTVPTSEYNDLSPLTTPIPWSHRSYHKRADGTFVKRTFIFSGGEFYWGDDLTGIFTKIISGFNASAIPLSATMQVSENSILYVFTGEDEVYKYDGNGSYVWEKTALNSGTGKTVIGAVNHLDRFWYWFKNSSSTIYSTTLKPENLSTDSHEIIVGQETDSVLMALVVGGNETLYLFKNQSIYQLFGRTPSTFEFRRITDKYGLAAKRAIYPVGGGFVFLNEFDKELYFFGGTESSITPLTEDAIRLREILDIVHIDKVCMTMHKGLFRMAYTHTGEGGVQNRELIYPIAEPGPDGLPIWSMLRGTKVLCYSVWNQQGDENLLLTGRSDTGKIMYHERSNLFDGANIYTQIRTREIVVSEDKVVRFKGFYIKGRPTGAAGTVDFKYYVNGRTSSPGADKVHMQGERRAFGGFGGIKISTQELFNNRIVPLHDSSLGNSIAFEIEDSSSDTILELYSIALKAQERYKIRSDIVG